eukprot:gnl/TRDRNA2_/TRDRNA2_153622_c2_seq2.p1 gnl/TRDRNA2_/TRDRNA2_153622_c2~~gnl/TRDRNA2_/TRDRNA2_153622_c2_seq2.p1  ORF type:complete len:207 (+),score=32.21 gnl/TRDRNA2_/TRDRNA2_153622_c2_seq2:32-622(+)
MAPKQKRKKPKGDGVPSHGPAVCCEDAGGADGASDLVRCANASAPPRPLRRVPRAKPLVLVMQLATPNLWDNFCRYSAATNAAWARRLGHRYLLTPGDFLRKADLWRGGNVRAVLEVMRNSPDEVDWLFHLDCDASIVDFSGGDALTAAIAKFATPQTEILLSRDETGFAGNSRLTNLGTGLWRKTAWTQQLLAAY